jgi:phosphoglucosamine mutase
MDDFTLSLIEAYLDGNIPELPFAKKDKVGITVDYAIGRNRYIGYLISLATRSYKGIKVGLDCANGSAWMIAKSVFDALGAKTYVINNSPDGLNINEGCGSTHIGGLQDFVIRNGLDIGFAFDGDADRCLAVDENGNVIDGDLILYICGTYLKECGELANNTVVTTVMSNLGLYKALDEAGIDYVKTPVGDKYVYENMAANGHRIGGEQSGHIIFSKFATTGDGILTSIMLMEVLLEKKMTLGKLAEPVTIYPQLVKSVTVRDKTAVLQDPDVEAAVLSMQADLNKNGRILVRPSGTEPLIRVMAEAESRELCELYCSRVVDEIKRKGHSL